MMCLYLCHAGGVTNFKLGMVQMAVGADKAANLVRAASLVKEAASNGAQVIALPVSRVARSAITKFRAGRVISRSISHSIDHS